MLTWLFSEKSLLVALVSDWIIRMGNCSSSGAKIYQELSGICFLDCFLNVVDLSFFCCSSMCRTQWKWETSWAAGHCWTRKYLVFRYLFQHLKVASVKIYIYFFIILRECVMSAWTRFVKKCIFLKKRVVVSFFLQTTLCARVGGLDNPVDSNWWVQKANSPL